MAPYYLSLQKQSSFQGKAEQWANIYPLNSLEPDFNDDWRDVATRIMNLEKKLHAASVQFTGYRVWNIASPAESVIVDEGTLSAAGDGGFHQVYRECAVLVRFPISRSATGRKRWLSKWLHAGQIPGATTANINGQDYGSAAFTTVTTDYIKTNYIDKLLSDNLGGIGPAAVFFAAADGERPTSGFTFPYLEHHQFHAGRKRRQGSMALMAQASGQSF